MSIDEDRTSVSWRVRPAAKRPGVAALGVLIIVGFAGMTWWTGGGWGLSVLAAVVLGLVACRFYVSTTYVADAEGFEAVSVLGRRRLAWGEVRRMAWDDRGGVVSSRAKASAWDRRAIVFEWGERRGEAEAVMRKYEAVVRAGRPHPPEEERRGGNRGHDDGGDPRQGETCSVNTMEM